MILCVDIGNTNIVIGGYEDDKKQFSTRFYSQTDMEADQYAITLKGLLQLHNIECEKVKGMIVSSVVPQLTGNIKRALSLLIPNVPLLEFSQELVPDTKILIDRPAELGADILAGAIAAQSYPLPAIIIDMGTATKLCAVDKNGSVLGVSIMPGLFISLQALTQRASLLRGISLESPQKAIGTNTTDSIKSGVILGAASMLDGMIERFEDEMGEKAKTLLATGGASSLVVPSCKHNINVESNLILDALYKVYNDNIK